MGVQQGSGLCADREHGHSTQKLLDEAWGGLNLPISMLLLPHGEHWDSEAETAVREMYGLICEDLGRPVAGALRLGCMPSSPWSR